MKIAIITGIFGQDGSYLCEILTKKGYEVHGMIRRNKSPNSEKIQKYLTSKSVSPVLHCCDIYQYEEVFQVIKKVNPDEIYHLAAKHYSSEMSSCKNDRLLYKDNITATFNILSGVKEYNKNIKVVLAGSCLMFDGSNISPQSETTLYKTISFYGLAKITEQELAKFFRNMGVFVCMAILYNHESPRRSSKYVTKKIISNLVEIYNGKRDNFSLGNLNTIKDWGYAKDYAYGMWLMAQADCSDDYILATGIKKTIKNLIDKVANELELGDWKGCIVIDEKLLKRKVGVPLIGDYSLAKKVLGWEPKIGFEQLVKLMVKCELHKSLD
jgi:GDPmannose 4,6-dehydratase